MDKYESNKRYEQQDQSLNLYGIYSFRHLCRQKCSVCRPAWLNYRGLIAWVMVELSLFRHRIKQIISIILNTMNIKTWSLIWSSWCVWFNDDPLVREWNMTEDYREFQIREKITQGKNDSWRCSIERYKEQGGIGHGPIDPVEIKIHGEGISGNIVNNSWHSKGSHHWVTTGWPSCNGSTWCCS